MEYCDKCGKPKVRLVHNQFDIENLLCEDCDLSTVEVRKSFSEVMSDLKFVQPQIQVKMKKGNTIVFGDADDYTIDNINQWLHVYKDGKKRATLPLNKIESVTKEMG